MGKAGLESCPLLFKISAGVRHNHRSANGLLNKKADGLMNPQRKSRQERDFPFPVGFFSGGKSGSRSMLPIPGLLSAGQKHSPGFERNRPYIL